MKEFFKSRFSIFICLCALLLAVLLFQVINLQIIQGDYYTAVANSRGYASKTLSAPRGEIVDRYGRIIAGNKTVNIVQIEDKALSANVFNGGLLNLLDLAVRIERPYTDSLPMTLNAPFEFTFDDNEKELKWKQTWKIDADESAEELFVFLKNKYKIENYDDVTTRRIMGLQFDLRKNNFGANNPFEFIRDVDISVISEIKENKNVYPCATVSVVPARDYPLGTTAAHIMGYIGVINEEEYSEMKKQGYGMQDYVGKTGLEKKLEPYLKGEDGKSGVTVEVNGKSTTVNEDVAAVPGDMVTLTIDIGMQQVAEEALGDAIDEIRALVDGEFIGGGAAVAIDVNSGEVLTIANYPGFNPGSFNKDYNKLINDKNNPIYNRAMVGTYSPGSTFKPLVALAGLQEGVITGGEYIDCTGKYQYYAPGYTPSCWIHGYYGGNHGPLNVSGAIENSCNVYFFETGRRLQIDNINKYARMFGFGEPTGIDIEGEKSGIVAGPEVRKELTGGKWYSADTIQAAIGQSDNKFTILQLANYCSALANKGTLYKPYLIKKITDSKTGEVVSETSSEVIRNISIEPEYWDLVHKGMLAVTTDGSTASVFKDAPYSVGGKTGTAQTSSTKNDSLFICYAPYDKPRIAIACIIENGGIMGAGNKVVEVAKKMLDSFFADGSSQGVDTEYNTLVQ